MKIRDENGHYTEEYVKLLLETIRELREEITNGK